MVGEAARVPFPAIAPSICALMPTGRRAACPTASRLTLHLGHVTQEISAAVPRISHQETTMDSANPLPRRRFLQAGAAAAVAVAGAGAASASQQPAAAQEGPDPFGG